jgi:hypothetical protein
VAQEPAESEGYADEPQQWIRLIESSDDPIEVLRMVGTYQRYLGAIEEKAVVTAKGLGRSWEEIGRALGVKRQSAWARFGPTATGVSMGTIHHLLPLPKDPTAIGLTCPNCGSMKVLNVQWEDDEASVRADDDGQEVSLPGEVRWTCPGCKRQRQTQLDALPRPA